MGLLILCAALAAAAAAYASAQFTSTFELAYLPSKPASSGGIETFMTWTRPDGLPLDPWLRTHVRTYYDQLRARGLGHHAALRQIANRLVGILHGCLKTHTPYNKTTAWSHHNQTLAA